MLEIQIKKKILLKIYKGEKWDRKDDAKICKVNKGRKEVIFRPGDWVWVHLRKDRFSNQRKFKLWDSEDDPFQIIKKINNNNNNNTCQLDLLEELSEK